MMVAAAVADDDGESQKAKNYLSDLGNLGII